MQKTGRLCRHTLRPEMSFYHAEDWEAVIGGAESLLVRVAALEGVLEEQLTWAAALKKVWWGFMMYGGSCRIRQ